MVKRKQYCMQAVFFSTESNEQWYSLSLGHSQLQNTQQDDLICWRTQRGNWIYFVIFLWNSRCSLTQQLFLMFLLIFPETGRVCVHLKHISLRTEWRISALLKSTKSAKMGHLWLMQIHIHIMFVFIFSCCNHLSYLVVYALLSMYMYLALTMKKGGLFWEYPVLSHF